MIHKVYLEDIKEKPLATVCRDLIKAGHPKTDELEAYRRRPDGDMLCLIVRNIGAAAEKDRK